MIHKVTFNIKEHGAPKMGQIVVHGGTMSKCEIIDIDYYNNVCFLKEI